MSTFTCPYVFPWLHQEKLRLSLVTDAIANAQQISYARHPAITLSIIHDIVFIVLAVAVLMVEKLATETDCLIYTMRISIHHINTAPIVIMVVDKWIYISVKSSYGKKSHFML